MRNLQLALVTVSWVVITVSCDVMRDTDAKPAGYYFSPGLGLLRIVGDTAVLYGNSIEPEVWRFDWEGRLARVPVPPFIDRAPFVPDTVSVPVLMSTDGDITFGFIASHHSPSEYQVQPRFYKVPTIECSELDFFHFKYSCGDRAEFATIRDQEILNSCMDCNTLSIPQMVYLLSAASLYDSHRQHNARIATVRVRGLADIGAHRITFPMYDSPFDALAQIVFRDSCIRLETAYVQ